MLNLESMVLASCRSHLLPAFGLCAGISCCQCYASAVLLHAAAATGERLLPWQGGLTPPPGEGGGARYGIPKIHCRRELFIAPCSLDLAFSLCIDHAKHGNTSTWAATHMRRCIVFHVAKVLVAFFHAALGPC